MAPPLALLLLATLALALCPRSAVSHAHGDGGFYDPARVTQLSWRPRAFLYSGFLSDGECDHLVNLVRSSSAHLHHYEIGQKYEAHFDYFHDKNSLERGGHQIATVLTYLTDVKKGGETVFPNAEGSHLQYKDEIWSECARSGLADILQPLTC